MIKKHIKFNSSLTLSILTGFFLGTSIIPFPPWALFFCLAPLFYIWIKECPKKVFLYTTLSFFIGSIIGFYWIAYLIQKFARLSWPLSILICLLFTVFCHIHISFIGFIFAKWIRPFASQKLLSAAAIFALSWSVFPLLFPWNFSLGWLYGGLEGYQFADIIGSDGISGLTIFLNALFLFSFLKLKTTKLPMTAGICFLLFFNFTGSLYVKSLPKTDSTYNVVIGQANIGNIQDQFMQNQYNYKSKIVNEYFRVTQLGLNKSKKKADLIIWPETAFPEYYDQRFFQTPNTKKLMEFIRKNNTNLITGVFAQTPNKKTANAVLFLNKTGSSPSAPVYKKILLAFGEYMPFEEIFPFLRKWFPMVGDFQRGESPQVRSFDEANIGIQICYEGLYPWFSRKLVEKGSQIMVNLTNDSWYGPYSQPWQHMYSSAFRVIENRQPLIRSTNTGISTVILSNGTFLEESPLYAQWGGFYEIPYSSKPQKTIYQRWGYAIPLPLIIILFIISLVYKKPSGKDKFETVTSKYKNRTNRP